MNYSKCNRDVANREKDNSHKAESILPVPVLRLIVIGVGTTVRAEVIYSIPGGANQYIFMKRADAGSAEEALQKLLAITMDLLNEVYIKAFFRKDADEWVVVEGKGGYYTSGV